MHTQLRFVYIALLLGGAACANNPSQGVSSDALESRPRDPPNDTETVLTPAAAPAASSALSDPATFDFANARIREITPPANFTDLSDGLSAHGRIRTDFTPRSPAPLMDGYSLRVRSMGNSCKQGFSAAGCDQATRAVDNPISWDVGQYTGFRPPAPVASWQFGYWDSGPEIGANAYQLQGTTAGVMINTWSFEHTQPIVGGGPNVVYSIDYSSPETPFRTPTSSLTLQAHIRLPWAASWNGAIGQLSFFFYLRDRTTGAQFAYVVGIWDSRALGDGNGAEFVGNDTQVNFVSSPLLPNTKYSIMSPYSARFRNRDPWASADFFRVHVFGRHIADAASAIEAQYPSARMSRVPTDYALMSAGILQEVFVGTDPQENMSMGASYTEFAVYEFY